MRILKAANFGVPLMAAGLLLCVSPTHAASEVDSRIGAGMHAVGGHLGVGGFDVNTKPNDAFYQLRIPFLSLGGNLLYSQTSAVAFASADLVLPVWKLELAAGLGVGVARMWAREDVTGFGRHSNLHGQVAFTLERGFDVGFGFAAFFETHPRKQAEGDVGAAGAAWRILFRQRF